MPSYEPPRCDPDPVTVPSKVILGSPLPTLLSGLVLHDGKRARLERLPRNILGNILPNQFFGDLEWVAEHGSLGDLPPLRSLVNHQPVRLTVPGGRDIGLETMGLARPRGERMNMLG